MLLLDRAVTVKKVKSKSKNFGLRLEFIYNFYIKPFIIMKLTC